MKSYLISDNRDTLLGMRLAGIKGIIVHEREEILNELNNILKNKDIGIVIVTEKIFNKAKEEIMDIKTRRKLPIIVVIPDRHGTDYDENFITNHIKESIGIKI